MKLSRRKILRKAGFIGLVSAGVLSSGAAISQEACTPARCNQFPTGGGKSELSREEFNKIASSIEESIRAGIRNTSGLDVSDEELNKIIVDSKQELEEVFSRHYDFY